MFTFFSKTGIQFREEHDSEIIEATKYLYDKLIPSFAASIEENSLYKAAYSNINNSINILIEQLHTNGINIRHLGSIRSHCKSATIRSTLLLEMICRVVKNKLRTLLREKMLEIKNPSELPYKETIATYLNKLLQRKPNKKHKQTSRFSENEENMQSTNSSHQQSTFWTKELKELINGKFKQHSLSLTELAPEYWLNDDIDNVSLLTRVLQVTAIKLSSSAIEHFMAKPNETVFVYADIRSLGCKQKSMNIATHATGMTLYLQSMSKQGKESDRLFGLALNRFESSTDNAKLLAAALLEKAKSKNGEERETLLRMASEKYLAIRDSDSLFELALYLLKDVAFENWNDLFDSGVNVESKSNLVVSPVQKNSPSVPKKLDFAGEKAENNPIENNNSNPQMNNQKSPNNTSPTSGITTITNKSPPNLTSASFSFEKQRILKLALQIFESSFKCLSSDNSIRNNFNNNLSSNADLDSTSESTSINNLILTPAKSPPISISNLPTEPIIVNHNSNIKISAFKILFFWAICLVEFAKTKYTNEEAHKIFKIAGETFKKCMKYLRIEKNAKAESSIFERMFERFEQKLDTVELSVVIYMKFRCAPNSINSNVHPLLSDQFLSKIFHIGEFNRDLTSLQLSPYSCSSTYLPSVFTPESARKFTSLAHLDLHDCSVVTDSVLVAIGNSCPKISVLNVSNCRKIKEAASNLRMLTSLDIHDCKQLNDVGLTNIIHGSTLLADLNLSGCSKLTSSSLRKVVAQLLNLSKLTVTSQHPQLSDSSFILELKNSATIQELHLSGFSQSWSFLETKAAIVNDNRTPSIPLNVFPKSLTTLKLRNCVSISEDQLLVLIQNLSSCQLEHLDLTRVKDVTNQVLIRAADHFGHCIQSLLLNDCTMLWFNSSKPKYSQLRKAYYDIFIATDIKLQPT